MKKSIGILIDSSCTYDETFIKQNEIEIIPLTFSDTKNNLYDDDNKSIKRDELLTRLNNKEMFKTATVSMGKLLNKVEDMLERYEQVIFLPISIGLSSQYTQSLIVQQDLVNKFFPIRSTSAAAANEFVLYKIVELIKAKKNIKEIVTIAENLYKYICTYFSCEDLSGMSSGGRVTKTIMKVINLFKLKPIIKLDNKNQYGGVGKNYRTITKKIINSIHEDFNNQLTSDKIKNIIIYYSGYEDEKKNKILELIADGFKFPKDKIQIRWVPNTILIHAHQGAYGVSIEASIEHQPSKIEE
jgi:DegV family protein with EDD domain